MKTKLSSYTVIMSCTLAGLLLAGCAQQQQRGKYHAEPAVTQAPEPAPAPAPALAPAAKTTCSDPTWGLIKMNKTMPPEAALGSEFMAELHLIAQACAANVVVRDTVPANASYVRSEPAATVDGNRLTWQLGDLESGDSRDIKLWLKAEQEGTIVNCASVSADPRTCAATHVVHPAIQLTKKAPAEVVICDPIPMTLTVKNTGSSGLTAVKVDDPLPAGLSSDGKSSLAFDAGNLAPGESKEFKFNATASKTGEFANKATAASAQGVKAEASSKTVVREPVLTVACAAPEQRYMGRPFDVAFTVANKGDTASAGTVLEVPVPTGLTVKSASDGGQASASKITWDLGALAASASQKVSATFVAPNAGSFQFSPSAKGTCAKLVSSTCQTRVVGVAAILLEKADDPDPVGIGETTTYTVKITNQGSADDNNVRMVVTIAPELAPVSATGEGVISGQTVTFPAVPRLASKEAVTYKIVAKGVKVGDGRTRFVLDSDMLQGAVTAEESTHVY
ncbi:MAG: hypothetical protein NT154_36575 [Verrucomicrobia bacterium]|nr:hypothetical protein [Verrucomicrobiota bacterium]